MRETRGDRGFSPEELSHGHRGRREGERERRVRRLLAHVPEHARPELLGDAARVRRVREELLREWKRNGTPITLNRRTLSVQKAGRWATNTRVLTCGRAALIAAHRREHRLPATRR